MYQKKIVFGSLLITLILICLYRLGSNMLLKKTVGIKNMAHNESPIPVKSSDVVGNFNIEIIGNKLIVNKTPFAFRGVTSNYFRYDHSITTLTNYNNLLLSVKKVHEWGINTLQFYINPELFDPTSSDYDMNAKELDEIIIWCFQNNIWVILDPVNDVTWKNGIAVRTKVGLDRRDNIAGVLENLSQKFGHYSNVIFGIEAEPKFIDNPKTINDRVDAIKKYSKNPIIIPLDNFSGSNVMDLLNQGLELNHIIVDIHVYPGQNLKHPAVRPLTINTFADPNIYETYPTLFGEFGGFWEKDFNTTEDILELIEVGRLAKEKNISFIAYALDGNLIPLFDKKGNINRRGEAVRQLLTEDN